MKTRIISAIIMLAIAIPLFLLGGWAYSILVLVLSVLATKELIGIRETKKEFPISMKLITYILVALMVLLNTRMTSFSYSFDCRIICGFFILYLLPMVFINDHDKYNINDAMFMMGIVLFLGISMGLFILIRNIDLTYILYLFLITILTDTFAFFTGNLVGKHKLCEKISPKKTVEGLVGGTFIGTIIPALYYFVVINPNTSLLLIVGITFILSLIGQCGDLAFSSIKRYYGKKDFSNLIPGHGGILDRLDSIIFVMLAYIIFMSLI